MRHEFAMHRALLVSIMDRQSGTLSKAVLEAISNSVDAGATRCDVTITCEQVTVADDGRGFLDEKEIEACFQTFGTPHTEEELSRKQFAQFRMGRGQLFSKGVNRWHTNDFILSVDTHKNGLAFDCDRAPEPRKGCHVTVDLYEKLSASAKVDTIRDLEADVAYLAIPVTINGKTVSTDPATEKWTKVTENAYIRTNKMPYLVVYNRGVRVMDYSAHRIGTGGVVVSRKQLKVNFARNEVMSECKVWSAIRRVVDALATGENIKKPTLNDAERQRLADQVMQGEIEQGEAQDLRLLTDVSGRHWSPRQFLRMPYDFNSTYTVAPLNNAVGDKLQQHKLCFVFAAETPARFGKSSVKALVEALSKMDKEFKGYPSGPACWKYVPFEELAKGLKSDYRLVPDKELSKQDKMARTAAASLARAVSHSLHGWKEQPRKTVVGLSDTARGWTDSTTFVAIHRDFLRQNRNDIDGWVKIGLLLLHEYCHDESDMTDHGHPPEFYRNFHDHADAVPRAAIWAFQSYTKMLERAGMSLPRKQAIQLALVECDPPSVEFEQVEQEPQPEPVTATVA